ncbi:hypothetical protein FPOAC2_10447 [Fusarium poae]|uniref:hypothetical protein n=1 Tax=Fusarium poae TaxID=36050 RepID=UPI001CE96C08|nr:hypothetical protein FPOAC1_010164 [Fusarium poae]KAG8665369.1 hypothetical protein FPOAC1_010164 [Fusarium poae]
MLLRAGKRIISWWTKSVLGPHHATSNVQDGASAQPSGYIPPNIPSAFRPMAAKDVVFSSSDTYKNDPMERQRIINKVIAKALPAATRAEVIKTWHVSRSDKKIHCTVDYISVHGRRLVRAHVYKSPAKAK